MITTVGQAAKAYTEANLVLVPFERGSKGPRHRGWNQRHRCIDDPAVAALLDDQNIGLAHAYSGTCCIDIDDMRLAIAWFRQAGIDLQRYVDSPDAVRSSSGRPNHDKLWFRLPPGIKSLRTFVPKGSGVELRCASANNLTMQDVLPPSMHPETKKPYEWIGPNPWQQMPILPNELLELWQASAERRNGNGSARPEHTAEVRDHVRTWDRADLARRISVIPPHGLSYDEWLLRGMALHHATGGHPDGCEIWIWWASALGNEKYTGPEIHEQKYASFHTDVENPVTMRSIDRLAAEVSLDEFDDISDHSQADGKSGDGKSRETLSRGPPGGIATATTSDSTQPNAKQKTPLQKLLQEINDKHALIWVNGRLWVMRRDPPTENGLPTLSSLNDVRNYFRNRKIGRINPFDRWLEAKNRKEYAGIGFWPGVCEARGYFNLWQGWGVTPAPRGCCEKFLYHLQYVICDGDYDLFDYALQWLADAVQRPQRKPGTALSFQGGQGSGKGAFVRYIAPIFGHHLLRLAGSEQLLGRFNDMFAAKLMIFADEAAWPGNKAGIEKLKSYITEDRVNVEKKYQSAVEIDNHARFIFATNRDNAAPAEIDDRRFVPFEVSNAHISDSRYWSQLECEREKGGPAHLLHYLLTLKLTRDLRQTPKTDALARQKILSLDDAGKFIRELLMQQRHHLDEQDGLQLVWGGITTPQILHKFYLGHCQRNRFYYPRSVDSLGIALRKFFTLIRREARRDEREALGGGDERQSVYVLPSLAEGRIQFATALKQPVPWDDDKPPEA